MNNVNLSLSVLLLCGVTCLFVAEAKEFEHEALAPRLFDRNPAVTARFRSERARDSVGARLHAMIQKQHAIETVKHQVKLQEKDVMRLREQLQQKLKTKEDKKYWWLDNLPWWMPPPPEWGPLPPQMYNSYYHDPEAPIFSTPNYGKLYQKKNDMSPPPMGTKADSERFIAKYYSKSQYHGGQYNPDALTHEWHPQPTAPIGNIPKDSEQKPIKPVFLELDSHPITNVFYRRDLIYDTKTLPDRRDDDIEYEEAFVEVESKEALRHMKPAQLVSEYGKPLTDSFGLRGPKTIADHMIEPEIITVPMEQRYDRGGHYARYWKMRREQQHDGQWYSFKTAPVYPPNPKPYSKLDDEVINPIPYPSPYEQPTKFQQALDQRIGYREDVARGVFGSVQN